MEIINGSITSPSGFSACGLHSGLKYKNKDMGIIYSDYPATVAGVFTTNKAKAAPLQLTQEVIKSTSIQAIFANSAIANACTGKLGLENAKLIQQQVAKQLHLADHQVAVASTGVIGKQLPMAILSTGIQKLVPNNTTQGGIDFSKAILTTDTSTKNVTVQLKINQQIITIAGTAKGSGMIHPNMATMLAFITTDATISHSLLQTILTEVTDISFNQITVDGDTSTNDMVLVLANGASDTPEILENNSDYFNFVEAFTFVCRELAKLIARDGEGASKLIQVNVTGALSTKEAKQTAKKIVGSSLVKTAIFGNDPNWGRIISAAGSSNSQLDIEKLDLTIGITPILKNGIAMPYSIIPLKNYLKHSEIQIQLNLNLGNFSGTAWGCDLTYDYVKINASYET